MSVAGWGRLEEKKFRGIRVIADDFVKGYLQSLKEAKARRTPPRPISTPKYLPALSTRAVAAVEQVAISAQGRRVLVELAVQGPHGFGFAPSGTVPQAQKQIGVVAFPGLAGINHAGAVRRNHGLIDELLRCVPFANSLGFFPKE